MTSYVGDLVELVIPTYRRPDALLEAVESALAETRFPVTVLDDHSPQPAEEALDVRELNASYGNRLRVIRNRDNLGASLNILHSLEVSRSQYTWAFTDDHVVAKGAGDEIVEVIRTNPEAEILFWHGGLTEGERLDLNDVSGFIDLIERGAHHFGQSDVHFNRIVRTGTGLRYRRLDARFSHAQPMLGIQLAALVDGLPVHMQAGVIATQQAQAASGWSTAYLQRFKLDPAYLIPDAKLRSRYRAVVARHFPWREALLDMPRESRGSVDEAFVLDAARLVVTSSLPVRLRAEAGLALFLRTSAVGRQIARAVPKKAAARHDIAFERMTW